MITELTAEQKARFSEFIEKWEKIGLCTEPANRKLAEEGVIEAYRQAGLPAPKIVWCDSPLSLALTHSVVKKFAEGKLEIGDSVGDSVRASVWDSVRASVWASVRASVWASVRASVRDSVWASVRASVWASVRASVRDSVGDSVRASVWDSVRASVWASVRASVWASVGDSVSYYSCVYGQHDANWLAFYDYFKEACGLEQQTQKLSGLWQVAQNAGWFIPHEKICWISERHTIVSKDDEGFLHSESGPAVAYPDGFSVYAIHGVRVPEYVVMDPQKITVADIESEDNAEIKRVKTERFGIQKYLFESGAEKIHQDDWGTLYRKEVPGDEPILMVHVVNSTAEPDGSFNDYFLRVDPNCRPMLRHPDGTPEYGDPQPLTALNAVASTYFMTGQQYADGMVMMS